VTTHNLCDNCNAEDGTFMARIVIEIKSPDPIDPSNTELFHPDDAVVLDLVRRR